MHLLRQFAHGVLLTVTLALPLMEGTQDFLHEHMKMDAAFLRKTYFPAEEIHQHGLAPANLPYEVDPLEGCRTTLREPGQNPALFLMTGLKRLGKSIERHRSIALNRIGLYRSLIDKASIGSHHTTLR
ncbi:hypothetical protein AA102526_2116 [Asaia lannensis NBRC 102526]|nr:hypothetical protein AA102526_2116 [Asaia lannensis NBRC 102526]